MHCKCCSINTPVRGIIHYAKRVYSAKLGYAHMSDKITPVVPLIQILIYSVQIRDVGRCLAKFNPWTNTFGNRLVRLPCSRIHPSVKLSTPKVYTCSLIVAVSWKISVSNY